MADNESKDGNETVYLEANEEEQIDKPPVHEVVVIKRGNRSRRHVITVPERKCDVVDGVEYKLDARGIARRVIPSNF